MIALILIFVSLCVFAIAYRRYATVALIGVLLVGGCGASGTSGSSQTPATPVTPPPGMYTLTTVVTGSGTIVSSPSGISCGATCSASFAADTVVTLTATPASGHSFTGWSGACSGTANCTVTMSAARNATATFAASSAGTTYYFSDCQIGAHATCVTGNNANAGTSISAPKRDFTGFNLNTLPAGTQLLFVRGGAWIFPLLDIENLNVTTASPLVFDAYGTGAAPVFMTSSNDAIYLGGNWFNTTNDGGYTFRNLKFDGRGAARWGIWFVQNVQGVLFENNEFTGFQIAINSNDGTPHGVTGVTLRNNNIHHNSDMGMLGHYHDLLMENNTFEANNYTGSGFSHGSYLGGGSNITIRNNRYIRNSVVNGVCQGGNMTFHGQIDGMLIEGNRIEQDSAAVGCWLMSITQGYATAEWFLNVVVRNNKLINGGNTGMGAQSAPGILVEGNVIINTNATNQTGISVGHTDYPNGDVPDGNAIVRNNTACQSGGATGNVVNVTSPNSTVTNNVVITGSAATTGICAR